MTTHPKITHGLCPICRHYGSDCTGKNDDLEKKIARKLGVSLSGLKVLAKQAAGRGAWNGNAGYKLVSQGYLSAEYDHGRVKRETVQITDAGRVVVVKARELGW